MKVIVFHSYKGGVGRTLALANFAHALSEADKRVLAIDMDFEAPGLPYKFCVQRKIREGYVDYLRHYTARERTQEESRSGRVEWLANHLITVDRNIQILPAGDPMSPEYWGRLASERFLKLFLFEDSLFLDSGTDQATTNIKAFVNDLSALQEAADFPDYLLVDCKGGSEDRITIPLIHWANTVISMFAHNPESLDGTSWIQRALLRAWPVIREGEQVSLHSVLCRVPPPPPDTERVVKEIFEDLWTRRGGRRQDESPRVLHEYRGIEAAERLALDSRQIDDRGGQLVHDYVDLFYEIAPEIKGQLSGRNWKSILGLSDDVQLLERFFTLYARTGELTNADKVRNVALRTASFREMMRTFLESGLGGEARIALYDAGHAAGRSFGSEMMETSNFWPKGDLPNVTERLTSWCHFDSQAGFGHLEPVLDPGMQSGTIKITNNFLLEPGKHNSSDINHFIRGYLAGVLTYLLAPPNNLRVEVTIRDPEVFDFRIC